MELHKKRESGHKYLNHLFYKAQKEPNKKEVIDNIISFLRNKVTRLKMKRRLLSENLSLKQDVSPLYERKRKKQIDFAHRFITLKDVDKIISNYEQQLE